MKERQKREMSGRERRVKEGERKNGAKRERAVREKKGLGKRLVVREKRREKEASVQERQKWKGDVRE